MTLRNNVLYGLRWTAGARVLSQFLSWFGTIIVIRLLSPDDYGIIAIGGFFILYLLLLSEGGLSDALVRERNLNDSVLHEVQAVLLVINGGSGLVLALSAPFLADYFDEPRLRAVLPVLASQFLIISVGIIPQAQLMREMRFKALSTVQVVQAFFVSAVTLGLALAGAGVWSLVVSNLAGLLLRSIVLNAMTRRFYKPKFRFREARIFTGFSGYVLMDRTVWHLLSNIDALLVSKLLGTTSTGVYAVAQNLASIPISKVAGILVQVALPAFSQIQDNRKRVQEAYVMAMRLVAVFAFPVGFGLALIAGPFIDLVLGEKWQSVKLIFQILAFSIPFRLLSSVDGPLLLALGHPKVMLQNRLLSLALLVTAMLIASRWGLTGIAVAWAIAAPLMWIATTVRFCRRLEWNPVAVLSVTTAPCFAATIMFLVVEALHRMLADNSWPPIPALSLAIPLSAAIYLGTLWIFARPALSEAVALVRGILLERRLSA